MHRLSLIAILFLGLGSHLQAQSPHGEDFKANCSDCHTTASWDIPFDAWKFRFKDQPRESRTTGWNIEGTTHQFDHSDTRFALEGQHMMVDCRDCHESLVFSEAKNDCISCHTDVHRTTLGSDCARCHTPNNWLIDDIQAIHQDNGFPLIGVHAATSCTDCHISESSLEFPRIGNDCVNCHLDDFEATTNPDHEKAHFSTDCADCHSLLDPGWTTENFDHSFFPLTKGHDIADCAACHADGIFEQTPTDCFACHQAEYEQSADPDHQAAGFPVDCKSCHTTDPGWNPAIFSQHDDLFPIYSGAHEGEWSACVDCHINQADFTFYDCTGCHVNPETNDQHEGVNGYIYESTACVTCHPLGDADNPFDHNETNFPLTGVHLTVDCQACHSTGFEGTPTECEACHTTDFEATTNPDHQALGLSTNCASCHTTDPGWRPASFEIHDDYYVLNGAHVLIATDCATCHAGNYNNTANTCAGCHTEDYNATTDPDHQAAQFPTDCVTCHTESEWIPSTFDHNTYYPLTGGHALIANDCAVCHAGDYDNTPTTCAGCHTADYEATVNPDHQALGLPTDCESCHTTEPDWMPATFDLHDDYYPLNGAHALIANDCAACHAGDYNNTANTCFGCHADDYNATTNPDHATAQFPTDCTGCHTESEWVPAIFDHDAQYFPIYSGAHEGEWSACIDCHTNPNNYAEFSCINCHTNPQTDDEHVGVGGYVYENTACLACHPTGDADNIFDHNQTAFPLTGAHLLANCLDCHSSGYGGTPTACEACHTPDYEGSTNPDHQALGLPMDCAGCHDTDPGWSPATFDIHDDYYPLNGAHAGISNDCATCHAGNYNNTANTCAGCHTDDYNATTDPDHQAAQFPTDCATCHTESEWIPSTFDHNTYYPLTGGHALIANDCAVCHAGDYDNTPTTCAGCHTADYEATVNPDHQALGLPTDCESCHTTEPDWMPATFDLHDDYYPLNGAHALIANDCAACHAGDYNNTANTCFGCHADDYNATTNPDHATAQFPTDCTGCHTESEWVPAIFDHDAQYFPIYSGAHEGEWSACIDCHTNPNNYAEFSCINCHTNPQTDDEHVGVGGYVYENTACLACHPTGDADNIFDHNQTAFPLTGAHLLANCLDCHSSGYGGTPTACEACHTPDYEGSTNPDHQALGLPMDCAGCHDTDPGWSPATFDIHDDYYPLKGAHATISNDCAACHAGNYNNTANTCAGCHTDDYNATTDPDHQAAQFPTDCATCHTESEWVPSTFDHNTYYPLTGAHADIADDCVACHAGSYNNTPNTCDGCHTDDYSATTNPDHQALGLPMACNDCHTTDPGWSPATFDIHDDYYPLNGAHAGISNDCAACHAGNYNNTPNTCAGCHTDDYNATTDPDHQAAQFPTDCATCHTESEWIPSTFDHNTYYPLTGAHADIADDCVACHAGSYNNTPNTCDGCHTDDYNATTNPDHQALGLPMACNDCHTTDPGWSPATFDIHDDYYPLNGAHAGISNDCAACHAGNYNNTPNTCAGCHTDDYNATTDPDHQAAQFPTDCATCHTESEWIPSTFDHNTYYPLTGAHADFADDCVACHAGSYNNTPNTCDGCHTDDYNATTNPDHQALGLPMACDECHTTAPDWSPATFNIHGNFYPLTGAHADIANDCAACHAGNYNNTPNTCDGCHVDNYNATTNPDHQALGLPMACDECHTTAPDWSPATFSIHDNYYPLNGAHADIANDCAACHNGNYNNTPNTCDGCHIDDYNATTSPDHVAAQLPTSCDDCHTETAWVPSSFDHSIFYPFTGAHVPIANDCNACHNGNYNNTPNTCDGCHMDDYNGSNNPNHGALGLSTDCESCHTTDPGWSPAEFAIHDDFYPLTGGHALIANDCVTCHNGNYNNTPNTCDGCHMDDYNASTNPNHGALGIPTACDDCHTTAPDWMPATFDIHNNYYPLNGAHAIISNDCAACHNGNYNNTPNTCFGCHEDDYNQTTNPNHLSGQFPTDCQDCHSETAWIPSTFDHNTIYPFTGAHIPIANDCNACHNGNYNNTPNTCDGCHMDDYNASTNPNHGALGIPTACDDCHTTAPDWMPATFDIHNNYYPLNGAHAIISNDCAACHNGNYNNTPNTCFGCHEDDYNQTTNPNHASAGFPTDCEACHSETAWIPASFDHDGMYFPIYSGKHEGEWNACVDCHTTPGNYALFSCIDCHEHDDPVEAADDHEDVSGYIYESNACYNCHPTGED